MSTPDNKFYVYALVDNPTGSFDPAKVFYVGKGSGKRWTTHFSEALRSSMREIERDLEDSGIAPDEKISKLDKIRKLRDDNDGILAENHAFILIGDVDEKTAFRIEALAKLLLQSADTQLTNIAAAHHEGDFLRRVYEVRRFFEAERLEVTKIKHGEFTASDLLEIDGGLMLLLRSDGREMSGGSVDRSQSRQSDRMKHADHVEYTRDELRRHWDPNDPWSNEEAKKRAARYWSLDAEKAAALAEIAAQGRLKLALAVRGTKNSADSVIRYVWHVTDGRWEDYGRQWGFPLGLEDAAHPWLGKVLIAKNTQRQATENVQQTPGIILDI